jgi:L-asparaginase
MEIKIFTTGGSIDKLYSALASNFIVDDPQIGSILQESNVNIAFEIEPLFQKDSLEITEADRSTIFQKVLSDPHHHIIITHGTDTMILTGKMLCEIPGKVIILTGAMQPAAFKVTDAAFNIGGAVIAAQTLSEGIYIVMNGQVFDPFHVRKNLQLNQFELI